MKTVTKMKAIVCTKYGPPEVLRQIEKEIPVPGNNEILVKIHSTAVTASDCIIRGLNPPGGHKFPFKQLMKFGMRMFLGFSKPRNPVLGLVFSGSVESVGEHIKSIQTGDEVYGFTGLSRGAYAEYKRISEEEIRRGEVTLKPVNISHEEAAALVYGGVLAMHFMKDNITMEDQKVLIYGASGAIGTFAVQFASYLGAEVTAVCGSGNVKMVKSLGAGKVIDYTCKDAVKQLEKYDLIFDAVGKNKSSELKKKGKKSLTSCGNYVSVDDRFLKVEPGYLKKMNDLIKNECIKAVIDMRFRLEDMVEAHKYVELGHKKGNVIINMF